MAANVALSRLQMADNVISYNSTPTDFVPIHVTVGDICPRRQCFAASQSVESLYSVGVGGSGWGARG